MGPKNYRLGEHKIIKSAPGVDVQNHLSLAHISGEFFSLDPGAGLRAPDC